MANDINDLMPKVIAQGLLSLRELLLYPRRVNSNYGALAAQKGDTIHVPTGSSVTGYAITPSNTPPAPADSAPSTIPIQLNDWYGANFHITDKQLGEIDVNASFLPMQTSAAMRTVAGHVNSGLAGLYKKVGGAAGTPGTTPFASDVTAATAVRKVLQKQLCPLDGDLSLIIDPDAEEKALNLSAFNQAYAVGSPSVILEGDLGRKLGFNFGTTTTVPSHTAGTITTGLTIKSATAHALGETSLTCRTAASTGACALKEGDVITIGSGSTARTYAVAADATQASANTDVTVTICDPGLTVALSGGEAVTVAGNHVANLAFHRDAFALAVRPTLATDMQASTRKVLTVADDQTGLAITLEVTYQYHQWMWEFSILHGKACVRPQYAARLYG